MNTETKPEIIRVFIAVALEEQLLTQLTAINNGLQEKNKHIKARWYPPENLHLTLRFIGSMDKALLPELSSKLEAVIANQVSFSLNIYGIGIFPSKKHPRVIAAENEITKELTDLVTKIENVVTGLGFTPETRPYRGHITIARIKSRKVPELNNNYQEIDLTLPVNNITIYESKTLATGAIYTPLKQINFKS